MEEKTLGMLCENTLAFSLSHTHTETHLRAHGTHTLRDINRNTHTKQSKDIMCERKERVKEREGVREGKRK